VVSKYIALCNITRSEIWHMVYLVIWNEFVCRNMQIPTAINFTRLIYVMEIARVV